MPIYSYKNPKTNKLIEAIRPINDRNKPLVIEDGTKCKRFLFPTVKRGICIIDKNAEVFEKDPEYVKKCKPKYVKFRDGHREKYDPTRHC